MADSFTQSQTRASPKTRPPSICVPPDGQWQTLSPRSADRLLGLGNGIFGDTSSPLGSPRFSGIEQQDSRRRVLLGMTFANLVLGMVLVILGAAGPRYPGHSGTTDNAYTDQATRRLATRDSLLYEENCPTDEVDIANASILHSAVVVGLVIWMTQPCSAYTISDEVTRKGATVIFLTSVVCVLTSLGAFIVVMLDINYIAGCCFLMEDNCEVSNLCTQFVVDCCISDAVMSFCDSSSFHNGTFSMIFMMFVSTSAIMVMSFTMTCRCWIDSDPEKQALMMVLTGSPAASRPQSPADSPRSVSAPASPVWSPRTAFVTQPWPPSKTGSPRGSLSPPGEKLSIAEDATSTSTRLSRLHPAGSNKVKIGGGVEDAGSTREKCQQCGAVFGDAMTLTNHMERFHPKGPKIISSVEVKTTNPESNTAGEDGSKPSTCKGSEFLPDDDPRVPGPDSL